MKGSISSWRQFDLKVRSKGCYLLDRLDRYPDAILVTGCQRSGTTILSRVLTQSEGMVNFQFGHDDELDAALILSGRVSHDEKGRYCFQTTYVNNCYKEYFDHDNFRMIWVLRNPHSVVFSMLHNWRRSALNRLFRACGADLLTGSERSRYATWGTWGISRLRRACLSYNAKVSQLGELSERLGPDRLMTIDYDDLVHRTSDLLPKIYRFSGLDYKPVYAERVHRKSVNKVQKQKTREATAISELCMPVYHSARAYLSV